MEFNPKVKITFKIIFKALLVFHVLWTKFDAINFNISKQNFKPEQLGDNYQRQTKKELRIRYFQCPSKLYS